MVKRVLIANRGEIALRIIRACRELDVETVAVYSQADESSLAAQLATRSLCIGAARAADSYLNQDAILSAALAAGCDAVAGHLVRADEHQGRAESQVDLLGSAISNKGPHNIGLVIRGVGVPGGLLGGGGGALGEVGDVHG